MRCGIYRKARRQNRDRCRFNLYNSDGLLIKEITYEQGEIIFYSEHYYNENGNLVKRTETYANGSGIIYEYEYKHQSGGRKSPPLLLSLHIKN